MRICNLGDVFGNKFPGIVPHKTATIVKATGIGE